MTWASRPVSNHIPTVVFVSWPRSQVDIRLVSLLLFPPVTVYSTTNIAAKFIMSQNFQSWSKSILAKEMREDLHGWVGPVTLSLIMFSALCILPPSYWNHEVLSITRWFLQPVSSVLTLTFPRHLIWLCTSISSALSMCP